MSQFGLRQSGREDGLRRSAVGRNVVRRVRANVLCAAVPFVDTNPRGAF